MESKQMTKVDETTGQLQYPPIYHQDLQKRKVPYNPKMK